MIIQKRDIRSLTLPDLQEYLTTKGEARFRAKQVYDWLWKKGVASFDEMLNISKPMRESLAGDFSLNKW